MSDLIERLRKNGTDQYDPCGLCDEAADEIERLQREWKEDLKAMTLQWEIWEESDKAKDAEIERLREVRCKCGVVVNESGNCPICDW